MLLTPAQIKPKSSELRQPLFILPGVDESHVYMSVRALGCFPQSYQYQNLSEGADCVGGQLRRDKECPFSGRIRRKEPESDARSMPGAIKVLLFLKTGVSQNIAPHASPTAKKSAFQTFTFQVLSSSLFTCAINSEVVCGRTYAKRMPRVLR